MNFLSLDFVQRQSGKLLIFLAILVFGIFAPQIISAHQQPTTIITLDVSKENVLMKLEIPLTELELAFGHNVSENSDNLIERFEPQLKEYLLAHVRPHTGEKVWSVNVENMRVEKSEQEQSGAFKEIKVSLKLTPPENVGTRQFTLDYDVIMHQVVTHKALVSIRNDWETGVNGEHPTEAGVLGVDTATGKIAPVEINLEKGSLLTGFAGMLKLGIQHIREGTDHLLFLLVLLLPAPLLVKDKKWSEFGGSSYSVKRLLKIVTAFTVGHSITLLVGALGWVNLPTQPVEVLIAVSILVSAVHTVRPIFPGKEIYVAAGFGLIHGLAFATVLSNLNLGAGEMALSILGFNIGIELMQLFVIALIVPWLILISQTSSYKWLRPFGAILAAIAAVAWIVERISGNPNPISESIQTASESAYLGIFILAVVALATYGFQQIKNKQIPLSTQ